MFGRIFSKGFAASALGVGILATTAYNSRGDLLCTADENKNNGQRVDPWIKSKRNEKVHNPEKLFLLTGNANRPLAEDIAKSLGTTLANATVSRFSDGEINIQIKDNVRGKDVYIIQPTCPPVNENLMELLLLISTARRSSAKKVTAVMPYYGYARQDRKLASRVPISAADVAKLLETVGVDRIIAMDLHCGQIQGFFSPRVPADNLDGNAVLTDYVLENKSFFSDPNNIVVVSPDAGGVGRAKKFQERLQARGFHGAGLAMIIKQRKAASQIERMDLVGSVTGKDCIVIDDIVDTAVFCAI